MTENHILHALWTGAFLLIHLAVIARVILRPHREPASRIAWIVVIIVFPVIALFTQLPIVESKAPKKSLRIAPPLLPIAIQTVYSFQIIVPVVQRIEQGFPKDKTAFLQESPNDIRSIQLAVFEVVD